MGLGMKEAPGEGVESLCGQAPYRIWHLWVGASTGNILLAQSYLFLLFTGEDGVGEEDGLQGSRARQVCHRSKSETFALALGLGGGSVSSLESPFSRSASSTPWQSPPHLAQRTASPPITHDPRRSLNLHRCASEGVACLHDSPQILLRSIAPGLLPWLSLKRALITPSSHFVCCVHSLRTGIDAR